MTSSASTVRLTFDYDWCTRSDTVDQCHLLLTARVRANSHISCRPPNLNIDTHQSQPTNLPHQPTPTQVLGVLTAVLEASAVVGALIMECRAAPGRWSGSLTAEYACVALSTAHMVCAVLMLVVWSSVQDELRAQDLTSGVSKIHFGCVFVWMLVCPDVCIGTAI